MRKITSLAKSGLPFHISFYVLVTTHNSTAYYEIREIHLLQLVFWLIILNLLLGGMADFSISFHKHSNTD